MKYDHIHSVEQLGLLQQYISILTLLIGLPTVGLLINKDNRFHIAFSIYFSLVIIFIYLYNKGNKTLFPDVTIT